MYALQQPPVSRRLVCLVAAPLLVLVLVGPAAGDIVRIDPFADPEVTLPPEEAARLGTLLSASFPPLISDVSPDDRTILTATPTEGVAFLDLDTRATVPVAPAYYGFQSISEFRWRNRSTLTFVAFDGSGNPVLVSVSRADGAVTAEPLALTGFPVSLSTKAGHLVVARTVEEAAGARATAARRGLAASPFVERSLSAFKRPGPAVFDAEKKLQSVRVATILVELAVLDLASGEDRPLLRMAPETGLTDVEWSRNDDRLAIVRWQFPDFTRGGVVPTESDSVQDHLGRLRPSENPFFLSSAFDLFRLDRHRIKRVELRPTLKHGSIFLDSVWSPDGDTVMVQMWDPGTPKGHPHPVYGEANRSHFHFYSARGRLIRELDRPEIESSFALLFFPTESDVVILAPFELSFGLFHYDLRHDRLRRLPTEKGSIYQARASSHSRELIYNFGSFESPYEMYKIHLGGHGPRKLTNLNESVAAANRIRADKVRFHLEGGETREGFLLQPRGAAFPPCNVRLLVWQQGGPTSWMTEDWGGFVEQPFNLLPNFGFALLMVPLPGRIGFGPRFMDGLADRRNFGQVDIDEQAHIARQLVDRGWTSRRRLGITGCSYGGYFTSQSIVRHPSLYAAANTQCTLLDLVHEFEFGYRAYIAYLMGRTLDEDPAEYEKDSPGRNGSRVKTPTLIFAGTEDFLPYTLSEVFHDDIAGAGTSTTFYQFLGEGHGLFFFNSQLVAAQAQLEWFRQHLAP